MSTDFYMKVATSITIGGFNHMLDAAKLIRRQKNKTN